jgi:MoxR-like ATPase
VPVDYPTPAEEREIVNRFEDQAPIVGRLLDPEEVVALQASARAVEMDDATTNYAIRLVLATRDPIAHGLPQLAGLLEYGASPRASLGLVRAAKALALLRGRDRALPQDVYDVAYDVLNLRLVLSYRALADGLTIDDVLVALLSKVWAPVVALSWTAPDPAAPLVGAATVPAQLAPEPPVWVAAPSA